MVKKGKMKNEVEFVVNNRNKVSKEVLAEMIQKLIDEAFESGVLAGKESI